MNEPVATLDLMIDPVALVARLVNERAPDIVDALNQQSLEVAAATLSGLPTERAIEVMDQPGLDRIADIIGALPRHKVIPLLGGMSADRVADVFRQLEEPGRTYLLDHLDPETEKDDQNATDLSRG